MRAVEHGSIADHLYRLAEAAGIVERLVEGHVDDLVVDIAVEKVAKDTKDGKFPGGKIVEFGLQDGGVDIAPSKDNISEDILTKVDEYKKKMMDGEIKVPATDDEYKAYEASL